jgi:ribosomal protein S9
MFGNGLDGNLAFIPAYTGRTSGAPYYLPDPTARIYHPIYKTSAARYCHEKNRDLNGNGILEPSEIHWYATEQTMDARQWQIIENKAKFIEQVRKGDIKTRVIEDIEGEAANAGAMKAAASGNPLILEEMALKKQLNDLDSDKTRHDREQHRIKATIKRTKDSIESLENEQSRFTTLSQAKTPSDLDITINGKTAADYLSGNKTLLAEITDPLAVVGKQTEFDVSVLVSGGGLAGQVDAIKMAIAKAITVGAPDLRSPLKKAELLRRDPREKERKKYGLRSARKREQYSKR